MKMTVVLTYRCAACDVEGMADQTGQVCWVCGSAANLERQTPWHGGTNGVIQTATARCES